MICYDIKRSSDFGFAVDYVTQSGGDDDMNKIQKTEWGQVEWLNDEDLSKTGQAMSIGVATINPHVAQEVHVHYGDERFIYILQGEGIEYINGETRPVREKMFYHLPPDVAHALTNTSDYELRHLLISVSADFRLSPEFDVNEPGIAKSSLFAAVEAIRDQIMEFAAMPITIFDDMGNLVFQNKKYPDFCICHCSPDNNAEKCSCFSNRCNLKNPGSVDDCICPYGLTVFRKEILYGGTYLGSIFGGHILLGRRENHEEINMYDTPWGTMLVMKKWMDDIEQIIVSFCRFDALRQSLSQKENLIAQKQKDQQALEADLKAMRNTVTNLKINHHFLFNTLNAIAGQALEGDRLTTYQTIVDLAKMFRYTTTSDLQMVPLRSELEYLNTYLHMQKLRYKEKLQTTMDCEEGALCGLVPFNFLQPIIENAFSHGFSDFAGDKKLQISISIQKENLVFRINNNGDTIDEVTLNRVRKSMESNSGHGLSLVFSKLQAVYGSDFSIRIESGEVQGTRIYVTIPYQPQRIGGEP